MYSVSLLATRVNADVFAIEVKLWTVTEKVGSFACYQLEYVKCNMRQCTVLLKDKSSLPSTRLLSSNICRVSKS